jgi:hypothetical protein
MACSASDGAVAITAPLFDVIDSSLIPVSFKRLRSDSAGQPEAGTPRTSVHWKRQRVWLNSLPLRKAKTFRGATS